MANKPWVMASERVAFYMVHPRRSQEAYHSSTPLTALHLKHA
jgi:hypothetical protein